MPLARLPLSQRATLFPPYVPPVLGLQPHNGWRNSKGGLHPKLCLDEFGVAKIQ